MEQFSYLATVILFAGTANVVIWLRNRSVLTRHIRFIALFVVFTTPFAYFESFALSSRAWAYDEARTVELTLFGSRLESYVFMASVSLAICSVTLIYAEREDLRRRQGASPNRLRRSRSGQQ